MNRPETLAQTPPGPTDFPRGEIKKNPRKMSLSDDSCEHEDTVSEWEMVRGKSTNIWAGIQIYSHPCFEIQHCNIMVVELRAAVGLIEAAGDNNVYSGQHQHHPSPSPILKPSIVMTAPRCLPRFPVPPAASDGSVGAADEVPPLGPSEVGTISQHDANIRILADLTAILAVAKRGSGGNRQRAIPCSQNGQRATRAVLWQNSQDTVTRY